MSVEFHGHHRLVTRTDRMDVPVSENGRVGDLIACLNRCFPGLRLAAVNLLITVNDQVAGLGRPLSPNDIVAILPHIGGG